MVPHVDGDNENQNSQSLIHGEIHFSDSGKDHALLIISEKIDYESPHRIESQHQPESETIELFKLFNKQKNAKDQKTHK